MASKRRLSATIAGSIGDYNSMKGASGVFVSGNHAYVTAKNLDKLVIVDITDKANPSITGSVQDRNSMDGASAVFVSGNYAYVAALRSVKLLIVDITDKANPSITGSVGDRNSMNGASDVVVSGNYAYVAAKNLDKLVIVDITDKANPSITGSVGDASSMDGASKVFVSCNYLYVAASAHQSDKLVIVNVESVGESNCDPSQSVGESSGDPHLLLPLGGHADIRGEDGKKFVLVSAPNVSLAAETTKSDFQQKMGQQTVHGTHFTKAFFTLRTNTSSAIVHVTVTADITPWFYPTASVTIVGEAAKPRKIAFRSTTKGAKNTPSFTLEDVSVVALSRSKVVVSAAGWVIELVRRTLYKPLPSSKVRNYLNVNVRTKGAEPRVAHGILGQAFGYAALGRKVEGKLDDYNGTEVTTSAQAEGAIDGVYTDYTIASPFDTTFKYSRFNLTTSHPATNWTSVVPLSASADWEEDV